MKIKKFNEATEPTKIFVDGRSSYSSPFSTAGLSVRVSQRNYNYKLVEGKSSIIFQTNEGGVIIDDVNQIEELINFLNEYKDKL